MNAALAEMTLEERVSHAGHRAYQLIRSHEAAIERLETRSPTYTEVLAMLAGKWHSALDNASLTKCARAMDDLLNLEPDARFRMQGDQHSLADWRDQLEGIITRAAAFKRA